MRAAEEIRFQFHQYFTSSFFVRKFFCAAFMCLQFEFVIFWRKDFGAKAAHKMLVKLTLGLQNKIWMTKYSTNVLRCATDKFSKWAYAGNSYWRGRLCTVDLLIKVGSLVKMVNNIFSMKRSWSKLESTRRSTMLILPLQ